MTTSLYGLINKLAAIETAPDQHFTYVPFPDALRTKFEAIQKTVVPDSNRRCELDHITLVWTKPKQHDVSTIDKSLKAMREVGADTPAITAHVQGWAYFDQASKNGKPATALVGLIDAPGLEDLHVELKSALRQVGIQPSTTHTYVPHVTFGYFPVGERVSHLPVLDGSFDINKVMVAHSSIHEVPLKGSLGKHAASALRSRVSVREAPHREGTNYTASLGDRNIGHMLVGSDGNLVHSELDDAFRNMGLGKKLYGDVIKQRGSLTSDPHGNMSPAAMRVWDGMANRPGYSVTQNPGWTRTAPTAESPYPWNVHDAHGPQGPLTASLPAAASPKKSR